MFESSLSNAQKFFINFNASKVRWLADSKISPSNVFCVGSGENVKKITLWRTDLNDAEPRILCDSENLDGDITELKSKNTEEFFASTTNGTLYHFKFNAFDQKLLQLNKWSKSDEEGKENFHSKTLNINSFDFEPGCDELCTVSENGSINFLRPFRTNSEHVQTFNYNQLCSLNSVLYLKQFEIAVADSLGRIKLWDTRNRDNKNSSMTLMLESACSPILCLASHPNQHHLIACGNANGLICLYDVRSNKKPFIMCHTHSEPVLEVCFHPFSCDNLISCSFDGSLWYWNSSTSGGDSSSWNDRNVNAKNFLSGNKCAINSFDINNENILAVNNNYTLFRVKSQNFI